MSTHTMTIGETGGMAWRTNTVPPVLGLCLSCSRSPCGAGSRAAASALTMPDTGSTRVDERAATRFQAERTERVGRVGTINLSGFRRDPSRTAVTSAAEAEPAFCREDRVCAPHGLSEQRKYRSWTAQQKLEIVLAGLRGDRSVREVCREHAISETLYYGWRDQLLEAGRERLAGKEERQGERELRRKVAELERALGRKTYELEIAGKLLREWD